MGEVADQEAADRDLGTNIQKDACCAEAEPRPFEQRQPLRQARDGMAPLLQPVAEQPDRRRDHRERRCDAEIAVDDRLRLVSAVGVERRTRQLLRTHCRQPAENQDRAEIRKDRCPERVKRLRERQSTVCGVGLAEKADERIGNDLDDHYPACEDEIGEQKHPEGRGAAGRDKQ